MIVHVMPTYLCDWRCNYCYLGDMTNNPTVLNLDVLSEQLNTIKTKYTIDAINIYGGEITLLPPDYFNLLLAIVREYADNISCITNNPSHSYIEHYKDINWGTSVNEERYKNEETITKLLLKENHIMTVTQVVTPSVLKMSKKSIFQTISMLSSSVTFLRYSPSVNNPYWTISNKDFSDFLKQAIIAYKQTKPSFILQNLEELDACIENKYDPTMQSNLFITPYGQLATIGYTENGLEYFKTLDSLDSFFEEIEKEKIMYQSMCNGCSYFNRCYAEHIFQHKKGDICCGLKPLLDWYGENIYKNH